MIPDIKTVKEETERIIILKNIEYKRTLPERLNNTIDIISQKILRTMNNGEKFFDYNCPEDLFKLVKETFKDKGYKVIYMTKTESGNYGGLRISWQ